MRGVLVGRGRVARQLTTQGPEPAPVANATLTASPVIGISNANGCGSLTRRPDRVCTEPKSLLLREGSQLLASYHGSLRVAARTFRSTAVKGWTLQT